MNTQDQALFDQYTKLDVNALSIAQLDFLRARRSYLNREQKKAYMKAIEKRDEEAEAIREQEEA